MNCKKGDMAWVVVPPGQRNTPWGKAIHMAIVTCEELFCNPKDGGPMWYIKPQINHPCPCGNPNHVATIEGISDRCLRPIRGDKLPGDHEPAEKTKPIVRELDFV